MKGDKELKESEQIKFEVEDKTYRMILTSVTPADAALYTVKAHNTAGSVSCSGRVKIQREYLSMQRHVVLSIAQIYFTK